MNEADKFALVPRPPGALERAEPGAKRVLTDMVQDTLALARTKVQAQNIPALPSYTNQFSDFIEQKSIKTRLELATAAAKNRGEVLGHVLLIGTPGSGKATLANILANVMGVNLASTSGTTIENEGTFEGSTLAGLLCNLEERNMLGSGLL